MLQVRVPAVSYPCVYGSQILSPEIGSVHRISTLSGCFFIFLAQTNITQRALLKEVSKIKIHFEVTALLRL